MTAASRSISWRERALALASMACGVLLAAFLVGFIVRNLGYLAVAVVGVP